MEASFFGAIDMVWGGFDADVVFLFLSTYEEDSHNTSTVANGYRSLAVTHRDIAVQVPAGPEESTTAFLLAELTRRDLLIT